MGDVVSTLSAMTDRISFAALASNVFGTYYLGSRSIELSNNLAGESAEVMSMVMAHVGQHALDHNLGRFTGDSLSCFDSEVRAFDLEILLWRAI